MRATLAVDLDVPGGLTIHNFYVPAGGDEPDPELNEKFAHKLAFLREMTDWYKSHEEEERRTAWCWSAT